MLRRAGWMFLRAVSRRRRSDDVQKLSDGMPFDVTSKGKNDMPSFKEELSGDEIRAAISHVLKKNRNTPCLRVVLAS
jgi:hypothetical protein